MELFPLPFARKKMALRLMIAIIVFFSLAVGTSQSGAEGTPREILQWADEARGHLKGVVWKVTILSVEGERQYERVLEVKARGHNFIASVLSPPNVKGQRLLMTEQTMWFLKPGTSRPVPITPKQKLMGAAAIGDIAATNYADGYEALSLPEESLGGETCYVFDLKASHKKSTYDRIKYWISKERGVGVKAQFFTVSNKMVKTATFEHQNQVYANGRRNPFISRMTITDALIQNRVTTLTFSDPVLVDLPDSTFDLSLLMTGATLD